MTETTTSRHHSFDELLREGYKRWYQFGWRKGPRILVRRIRHRRPRPVFRARMMWQRARRGWSIEDSWSFHYYLQDVILGGVTHLRQITHGHPTQLTFGEWVKILAEIEEGMWAAKRYEDKGSWADGDEAMFNTAMTHLHNYWFNLWD